MLSLADGFWQAMFSQGNSLPIICTFGMIVIVVGVPTIAHYWHQVIKTRAESDLKQSMIERGMSVEDIERVLRAKSDAK